MFETKNGHFLGKNDAKVSARDGLDVEDGSVVVCIRCSKEFMFFQRRRGLGIDD